MSLSALKCVINRITMVYWFTAINLSNLTITALQYNRLLLNIDSVFCLLIIGVYYENENGIIERLQFDYM